MSSTARQREKAQATTLLAVVEAAAALESTGLVADSSRSTKVKIKMTSISELISELVTPKKLLFGGLLALEIILSACGNTPTKSTFTTPVPSPIQIPRMDCQELKRKEFVPYGAAFVIRDFYDGKLIDVAVVQVSKDYPSTKALIVRVLVETGTSYSVDIGEVTEGGVSATYGPEKCFEEPGTKIMA